jgi:hypothetical protein
MSPEAFFGVDFFSCGYAVNAFISPFSVLFYHVSFFGALFLLYPL